MAEIADLTYNVVAFSEIMQMIWKRLNDHGKNWRHVYKALVKKKKNNHKIIYFDSNFNFYLIQNSYY